MGKEKKISKYLTNIGFDFDEYEKGGIFSLSNIQIALDDSGGMLTKGNELMAFDSKKELKDMLIAALVNRLIEVEKGYHKMQVDFKAVNNKVIERGGRINKLLSEIEEAKNLLNKIR